MGVLQSPRELMLLHTFGAFGVGGFRVLQGAEALLPPCPAHPSLPSSSSAAQALSQEPQNHILPPAPRVTPGWDISHPSPFPRPWLPVSTTLGVPMSRGASPLRHPFPGA